MNVIMLPDIASPRKHLSRLDPLVPKGMGTGQLESLTGYLCRLADRHWLTPYALRKYVRTHHSCNPDNAHKHLAGRNPAVINGQGVVAWELSTELNNATGRDDLLQLTLYQWAPALDKVSKGLLHTSFHWCSLCWIEDIKNNETPYVRLAWMPSVASCCTIHNQILSNDCPSCFAEQSVTPSLPRPWICQECGHDLFKWGSLRDVNSGMHPSKRQMWYAKSIEKLIERICCKRENLLEGCVAHAIDQLAARYGTGSSKVLSDKLNIPFRYLNTWRINKARPTLLSLFDLCYRLDIPPDKLLLDSDLLSDPAMWRDIEKPHFIESTRLTDQLKNEIRKTLKDILQNPPKTPPSVYKIAESFDISYTTLRSHFSGECEVLQQRNLTWRFSKIEKSNEDRNKKLLTGVEELVSKKIYPSERQLRQYGFLMPSDFRRSDILEALREQQNKYAYLRDIDFSDVKNMRYPKKRKLGVRIDDE